MIGDAQWNRLIAAIQTVGIYANLNFAEVDGDYMYMSQALIGPQGNIMHHRRKLRPSGAERYFFSDGVAEDLKVLETDYGRWGNAGVRRVRLQSPPDPTDCVLLL